MFLNRLVRSSLSYGCYACHQTCLEIAIISNLYNRLLRSMVKSSFERMKHISSIKQHPFSCTRFGTSEFKGDSQGYIGTITVNPRFEVKIVYNFENIRHLFIRRSYPNGTFFCYRNTKEIGKIGPFLCDLVRPR